MDYRRLGTTELKVSVLGFGSSPLGNVYGDLTPAAIQETVDAAVDHGVNFFDTSPYYGHTLAEERLGAALVGKREKVVLATKCGRFGLDDFDFSRWRIRRSLEESLVRLKTDHVDLLQAHDVEFADERQIVEETIPALRELQAEGKVRYIGITGYPVRMLRRVWEAAPVDTILSYCHYSLLNTDMDDVLGPIGDKVGLINASPMMMGVLTERGAPEWHVASDAMKIAGQRGAAEARRLGCSIAQLALQFSVDQRFAASTVVGMSSAAELEGNIAALATPVDPAAIAAVRAAIGNGFKTTWPSGLTENAD